MQGERAVDVVWAATVALPIGYDALVVPANRRRVARGLAALPTASRRVQELGIGARAAIAGGALLLLAHLLVRWPR